MVFPTSFMPMFPCSWGHIVTIPVGALLFPDHSIKHFHEYVSFILTPNLGTG